MNKRKHIKISKYDHTYVGRREEVFKLILLQNDGRSLVGFKKQQKK